MSNLFKYEAFNFFKKKDSKDPIKPVVPNEKKINYKNNYSINVIKTKDDIIENTYAATKRFDNITKYCVAYNKWKKSNYPDGEILLGDYFVYYVYYFASMNQIGLGVYCDSASDVKDKKVHFIDFTKEKEQLINMAKLNGFDIGSKIVINGGEYDGVSGKIYKFQIAVEHKYNKNPDPIFDIKLVADIQFDHPQTDINIKSVWKDMSQIVTFSEENVPASLNIELDELEDYFLTLIEDYSDDIEVKLLKTFDITSNYHSVEFNFKVEPKLEHVINVVDQIKKVNLLFKEKGYKIELNEINRLKIKIYIRPIK